MSDPKSPLPQPLPPRPLVQPGQSGQSTTGNAVKAPLPMPPGIQLSTGGSSHVTMPQPSKSATTPLPKPQPPLPTPAAAKPAGSQSAQAVKPVVQSAPQLVQKTAVVPPPSLKPLPPPPEEEKKTYQPYRPTSQPNNGSLTANQPVGQMPPPSPSQSPTAANASSASQASVPPPAMQSAVLPKNTASDPEHQTVRPGGGVPATTQPNVMPHSPVPPSAPAKPILAAPPVQRVVPPAASVPAVAPEKGGLEPQSAPPVSKPTEKPTQRRFPTKMLIIALLVFGLLAVVLFFLNSFIAGRSARGPAVTSVSSGASTTSAGKNITLTYWGLWEPAPVMTEIFQEFQKQNPGVTINYIQQSPKDYRERLQDALQKGSGPDVFRYHATWIPMMSKETAALPSSVMGEQEYSSTFYPVFLKIMKTSKGILGIPHMYEGLGLYYNTDLFELAKATPPRQWSDLEKLAVDFTILKKGKIDRGGVALGTTNNVDNFSDIMALLLLQNGADPAKLQTQNASDAFQYYINFAKVLKVWDDTLPNSTYAFATGKVAMMIAPSWRAHEVRSMNPELKFAIAPVPQLPGTNTTFASFWVEGVSEDSANKEMAWKLLKFMSSKEMLQKFYTSAAKNTPRLFGEIYPRPDMANLVASDPYVGAYVSDASKALTWFLASRTFDNGINDKIIKYYQDAINVMISSGGTQALQTAETGVKQVLQQYGVAVQ